MEIIHKDCFYKIKPKDCKWEKKYIILRILEDELGEFLNSNLHLRFDNGLLGIYIPALCMLLFDKEQEGLFSESISEEKLSLDNWKLETLSKDNTQISYTINEFYRSSHYLMDGLDDISSGVYKLSSEDFEETYEIWRNNCDYWSSNYIGHRTLKDFLSDIGDRAFYLSIFQLILIKYVARGNN